MDPPSLQTAGLHSAVETPRSTLWVADRSSTPPLTSAACALTVSVAVSGATFCWSAARLAETPLRFYPQFHRLREARPARSGYGSGVRVPPRELSNPQHPNRFPTPRFRPPALVTVWWCANARRFKTAEAPVGIEPTNRGFAGRGALTCNLSSVHSNALGPSCPEPRLTEDGSRGRYGRVVGLAL